MSDTSEFQRELRPNKTRRVFVWLTLVSFAFTIMWGAFAGSTAADQATLDERCNETDIITDADWGEACGEAVGNALGAGFLFVFAAASLFVTIVCLVVFLTRDKLKPVYNPKTD